MMRTVTSVLAVLLFGAFAAQAQPKTYITEGQELLTWGFIVSPNRNFFAMQQNDGNFCVYRGKNPDDKWSGVWCSMGVGPGGQYRAVLGNDGKLCSFPDGSSSATWCNPRIGYIARGAYFLAMQDDGNLCIYQGRPESKGENAWCFTDWPSRAALPPAKASFVVDGQVLATGDYLVAPNRRSFAVQQADGNLCVYKGRAPDNSWSQRAIWCSGRVMPGNQFVTAMQVDGNLCTYPGASASGAALWCSNKAGARGKYFVDLQNDGNLCVKTGRPMAPGVGALWCFAAYSWQLPDAYSWRPDGPYLASCSGQIWPPDSDTLLGSCHGGPRAPELNSSTLQLPCYGGRGRIENRNGFLRCEAP